MQHIPGIIKSACHQFIKELHYAKLVSILVNYPLEKKAILVHQIVSRCSYTMTVSISLTSRHLLPTRALLTVLSKENKTYRFIDIKVAKSCEMAYSCPVA